MLAAWIFFFVLPFCPARKLVQGSENSSALSLALSYSAGFREVPSYIFRDDR